MASGNVVTITADGAKALRAAAEHLRGSAAEDEPEADVGGIAADRLRSIIERIERFDEEIKALQGDKKDVMAEAKSAGFEPKAIKRVLALRKMDPADREELDTLVDLYTRALGM